MKNVKLLWLLWLFVVLPAVVLGRRCFRISSEHENSPLCQQWNCISTKLGLPNSIPSKETTEIIFRNALPEGPWKDVIGQVLENCYKNWIPRFNTCPGQALMLCVVDQMIDLCPVSSTKKYESCSPVTSPASLQYMFAQSRYVNLEKNLPRESRPTWFLKNYFNSKCCDLPVIFNTTVLEECGFTSFINYFDHGPRYTDVQMVDFQNAETTPEASPVVVPETAPEIESTTPRRQTDFMLFDIALDNTARPSTAEETTTATYEDTTSQRFPEYNFSGIPIDVPSDEPTDPLDCCEITKFIDPSWRSECNFHLSFKGQDRLAISSHSPATEAPTTTTTESTTPLMDIMLVPHSCKEETCVFRRMGIISDTGIFDIDAYIKMLDNFTETHPAWARAKARVLTTCDAQYLRSYKTECEINKMLACTLDVLTENCPYKTKDFIYRKHAVSCQISSSIYRPRKHRREICILPELIHRSHLQECGLETVYKVDQILVPPMNRELMWFGYKSTCTDLKEPTTCLLKKMGVLSKRSINYVKMKNRIRQFTTDQVEWAALQDLYWSAFYIIPMYQEHCHSKRQLLNYLDTMLMICPVSKRKNTAQCNKIFKDLTDMPPYKQNVTKEKLDEIMKHYYHVFMTNQTETANLH